MTPRRTIFMFSGQGSQYYQMGRQLYEGNATFQRWMRSLDLVVRDEIGVSVAQVLYAQGRTRAEVFDRTLLTSPAIFMVEYALAQCLLERDVRPDVVLGTSLGVFAAAAVAGCVDATEALVAVVRQASAVEATCESGGMVAVLASPRLREETAVLTDDTELASTNFARHFVLATPGDRLRRVERALHARRVTYQRLPVSFAFHSRWIDAARSACEDAWRTLVLKPTELPMACCVDATSRQSLSGTHLWRVVREPVNFQRTITHLESRGPCRYVDVGPSGTLATFVKYAVPAASASSAEPIMTPFGDDVNKLTAVTGGH